jgi:hypothetical protein
MLGILALCVSAVVVYVAWATLAVHCIDSERGTCTTDVAAKIQFGIGLATAAALIVTGIQLGRRAAVRFWPFLVFALGLPWVGLVYDVVT